MKKALIILLSMAAAGCSKPGGDAGGEQDGKIRLMTLDPGHFHAALVQKSMYPQVDSVVHVYAPEGPELKAHMSLIELYNTRAEDPTAWEEKVYTGDDFLQKMLSEKPGNVVVMAGNNQKKTEYILQSVEAGLNVLADKPMAINTEDFRLLQKAFAAAEEKGLLLYDIMTERYEITTLLQREFSRLPEVFGTLEKGTPEDPAVTKESVHHFFKYVSGKPLTRPAWFFDVEQEGDGIVDVTTHLVDLIQWECFPGQVIDTSDIELLSARRWPTALGISQFRKATGVENYPDYLLKDVENDSVLNVYANGEMNYTINGIHAKVSVKWNFQAPEGTGDTHYSIMRGSKANLVIRQEKEQNYKPTLYIEPLEESSEYEEALKTSLEKIQASYPGVELKKAAKGWEVIVPDKYKIGHEAHFSEVTKKYLQFLTGGGMPEWEVPNMITKYYLTTKALEMAKAND
ncbi:putative dehydrogenase [Anseongella ginsenosidimutans]|uniref:Putative dehydrogenase n=1 Tax=Anseongella ginsenosidimutans TaxID=496056 RepID=A0A4R3KV55_9SPHI|nr:putative oxidoreductase C-terminal domain-containing protein [Anseongella ginsenosidimutans]QEC51628.1 oxidoreductase [Anseongella ginsenosidimutans]TCS88961.1 putative dehydrogenase [Anseongella ginsenosidimutans]